MSNPIEIGLHGVVVTVEDYSPLVLTVAGAGKKPACQPALWPIQPQPAPNP